MLFVVPSDEVDTKQLRNNIMAAYQKVVADGKLSKWAMPRRIDLVTNIAKTSVGKLDKKQLRSMLTGNKV